MSETIIPNIIQEIIRICHNAGVTISPLLASFVCRIVSKLQYNYYNIFFNYNLIFYL